MATIGDGQFLEAGWGESDRADLTRMALICYERYATNSQEGTRLKFIRVSLLLAGLEILLAPYTTLAFAQPDPTKVLIGRWEGEIDSESHYKGRKYRRLIIRSVEPTETVWVAKGSWAGGRGSGIIEKGIDVSLQDGVIVLEFSTNVTRGGGDPIRLVLTGDNRLEGTVYYAQYKGQGIIMRTLRLSLEKKPRRGED